MKSAIVAIALCLAACASQPQQQAVNPLAQPLGASIPTDAATAPEPTPKQLQIMLPYLDKVYSDAVPEIEMKPFRECYGRTVYARMTPDDRHGFDRLNYYDDSVIMGLTRYFDRAIKDPTTRAAAGRLCPKYATAYSAM